MIAPTWTLLPLLCLLIDVRFSKGHPHASHIVWSPTVTPYPTETSAPSPSPSEIPTGTQSPSHSFVPSTTPTSAPTTPEPSANPTEFPTESPAPSPSPSEVPSLSPSLSPSISTSPSLSQNPSSSPTTSEPSDSPTFVPSSSPSSRPSSYPTTSPAPTITPSPTGPIFLTATGLEVVFQGIARVMDTSHVELFEEETKLFLQKQVGQSPGAKEIEIEAVTVTNQTIYDPMTPSALDNSQTLVVTVQVVASAILDPSEQFDLKIFLEIFFENSKNLNGLRLKLEQGNDSEVDNFWKVNSIQNRGGKGKSKIGGSIAGAFFGLAVSTMGLAGICIWSKRRRRHRHTPRTDKDPARLQQITFSRSYDTSDCLAPGDHNNTPGHFLVKSKTFESEIIAAPIEEEEGDNSQEDSFDGLEAQESIDDSLESAVRPPAHLMYTPALMTTESNIEVPETPVTAFTAGAARSIFTTPSRSGRSMAANSFLETPKELPGNAVNDIDTPSDSVEETKRKALLPSLWKSPFRRRDTTQSPYAEEDADSDVVVASFNRPAAKQLYQQRRNNRDKYESKPPSEIGRPETSPRHEADSDEENAVGIVDEVAYMYSTSKSGEA